MTMEEIDHLRGLANEAIDLRRKLEQRCREDPQCGRQMELVLQTAKVEGIEEEIEAALRKWWAQGCTEVPSDAEKPPSHDS